MDERKSITKPDDGVEPDTKIVETKEKIQQEKSQDATYSAFSKQQKVAIVCLISLAGFFSPFTAFVYFPALRSISSDLNVSLELINITVTVYLIVQAIVPSVLGDLAKYLGRRPVYLLAFAIYTVASIGLALQRSYAALLILRMLQSAGSSATIALAYAVISDIARPHEKGIYVGVSHIGFNTAPALGPIIGGLLADKVGWPWIFVFLAAFGGFVLLLLFVFLYETARNVVGDGSIPATGLNRSLYQTLRYGRKTSHENRARFVIPSIISCLKLIFHKNVFPVLLSNAIFYMMFAVVQATLAPLVQQHYDLSSFQAGLCYLGYGVAGAIASVTVGKITDHDYKAVARNHNFQIDKKKGDDLLKFPLEKARLRSIWFYIVFSSTALLGYGWVIHKDVHLAAAIVLQFIVGFAVTGIFNVCNTYIVDVFPEDSASASASVSITRCLLAAGGVSIVEPLMSAIGAGWTFTLIAVLCYTTIPILFYVRQKGWTWRVQRHERKSSNTAMS
ncbi:hypothetical protein H2198_003809 [Neophaeococcomyces mojaviensis]|uniref:Uncharacterized protein n=1 Tax=Neophaeococcomyces mojaviensis TaxID=3383035 RepID=A0ACC3AAD1_9EURO|nr:hypothetical protein H2198_003809 [Knufia sp. JES_112]